MTGFRPAMWLALFLMLPGCATGYLADRFQERGQIVEAQLIRFGLSAEDGRCVSTRLGTRLTYGQLRQMEINARGVRRGLSDPERLTLNDLIIAVNGMGDPEVRGELDGSVAACNIRAASLSVGTAIAVRAPTPNDAGTATAASGGEGAPALARGPDGQPLTALPPPGGPAGPAAGSARAETLQVPRGTAVIARGADGRPLTALPAPGGVPATASGAAAAGASDPAAVAGVAPTWLNLGAAGSGQAISIDGGSVERDGGARIAWFRMVDPGTGPSRSWFRLKIDCGARTIEPVAMRRVDEGGAIVQDQVYPPGYERPGPVENGTVMEIAFLSLCT